MADHASSTLQAMKDIKGYEGKYAITDNGRIWSIRFNRWLGIYQGRSGYLRTQLGFGNQHGYSVHRLVAETFLPPPSSEKCEINHKNGDRQDNRVSNLEWCTHQENCQHAHDIGLNRPNRKAAAYANLIRQLAADGYTQEKIVERFGIGKGTVHRVLKRTHGY